MQFKTMMLEFFDGFMSEARTAMFWSDMFAVEQGSVSETEEIEIELTRSIRLISTDVARGSGNSGINYIDQYSNKLFKPPLYSEKTPITAPMLNKKLPGVTKYTPTSKAEALAYYTAKAQFGQVHKIMNAMERQAVQAMTTGIITLSNQESVDYQKKGTLAFTPSVKWDAVSGQDPLDDFSTLCQRIFQAGKKRPDTAVFTKDAWDAFYLWLVANFNNSPVWIQPGMIQQAPPLNGATYQGVINVAGYRLDLFVYDDFYEDANGTAVPFMPSETVVVFARNARRVKAFAATEVLPFYEQQYLQLGMPPIPELVPGMFTPFALAENGLYYAGVQSAPLLMPVEIDTIGTIIDVLT